jgi:formyl-CoA transferase
VRRCLSMKEIAYDPALRASGMIVEVPHKQRGPYLTVGSRSSFRTSLPVITGSPLLGEHTDEVLASLGYSPDQIARMREANVYGEAHKRRRKPMGILQSTRLAASGSKK